MDLRPGANRVRAHSSIPNGDPPPSTFAAQIVESLADNRNSGNQDDRVTFRQLLREILDADAKADQRGTINKADVELNSRLIFVIIRAGLEQSISAKRNQDQHEDSVQASRCLSVIELTLRSCPGVLFFIPSDNTTDIGPGGPLYVWLIPRLLLILDNGPSAGVHAGIISILRRVLFVDDQSHNAKFSSHSILQYVKGCVFGELQISKGLLISAVLELPDRSPFLH